MPNTVHVVYECFDIAITNLVACLGLFNQSPICMDPVHHAKPTRVRLYHNQEVARDVRQSVYNMRMMSRCFAP